MCLCIQHKSVRASWDHRSFVNSPRLFADFHALHSLLTPRHPPCALNSLTTMIQRSPSRPSRRKNKTRTQLLAVDYPPRIPIETSSTVIRTSQRIFHKTISRDRIRFRITESHYLFARGMSARPLATRLNSRDDTPNQHLFKDANYHNKLPKINSAEAASLQLLFRPFSTGS